MPSIGPVNMQMPANAASRLQFQGTDDKTSSGKQGAPDTSVLNVLNGFESAPKPVKAFVHKVDNYASDQRDTLRYDAAGQAYHMAEDAWLSAQLLGKDEEWYRSLLSEQLQELSSQADSKEPLLKRLPRLLETTFNLLTSGEQQDNNRDSQASFKSFLTGGMLIFASLLKATPDIGGILPEFAEHAKTEDARIKAEKKD